MWCIAAAPGQRCIVWCSLFTLSGGKGDGDAWPVWHRLHTGNRPEGMSCCLYRLQHVHNLSVCESDALPVPRHQSIARCSLFILPGGKGTRWCVALLAKLAPRHRRVDELGPRKWIRFMLHVAACVMHCQLPGSDATCGAAYSPSQEARGRWTGCTLRCFGAGELAVRHTRRGSVHIVV